MKGFLLLVSLFYVSELFCQENTIKFLDTLSFKGYLIRDNKTGVIKLKKNIKIKNINLSFKHSDILLDPMYVRYYLRKDKVVYEECNRDFSSITKYYKLVMDDTSKYTYIFVNDIFYLISIKCSDLRKDVSYNEFCNCKKRKYIKMYSFYCYQ